jgi:DNA-binding NarL/FixJ family response regulator
VIRVLVVDDHAAVRASLAAFLDVDPDLEVVAEAADGRQAIDVAEQLKPDLVLMDVRMPVLDGIEATRLISAKDARQHVVIYTASEEYGDVARADEAGAAGFLHKDAVTSPELADALHVLHTNYSLRVPDPD